MAFSYLSFLFAIDWGIIELKIIAELEKENQQLGETGKQEPDYEREEKI